MSKYIEIPCPPVPVGEGGMIKAYARGECRIMVSRENQGGYMRWHLSISHPTRYPTWDEIRDARYALVPDEITMVMILPPKRQYVNVHPNCFHLHEIVGE